MYKPVRRSRYNLIKYVNRNNANVIIKAYERLYVILQMAQLR
jgi:hypothetical protein